MFAIFTGSIIAGAFGLVSYALSALAFIFWIWMLIHAIRNNGLSGTERVVWVLVVFFLPCVGALIYFFVGRPKATR
jgi:hypothetical protein